MCFERQHIAALAGTQVSTFAWGTQESSTSLMLDVSRTLLRKTKGAWVQCPIECAIADFGCTWTCIISNAPGRSIPLLLLDANGHTSLQMVQPRQVINRTWTTSSLVGKAFHDRHQHR